VWKATGAEIARHYLAQMKDGPSEKKAAEKAGSKKQIRGAP
jgi:hypothetical protein